MATKSNFWLFCWELKLILSKLLKQCYWGLMYLERFDTVHCVLSLDSKHISFFVNRNRKDSCGWGCRILSGIVWEGAKCSWHRSSVRVSKKLYIFWLHYSEIIVSSSTITCEAHKWWTLCFMDCKSLFKWKSITTYLFNVMRYLLL